MQNRRSIMVTRDDFEDLKATLAWGAKLDLAEEQRKSIANLCCKIGAPLWVSHHFPVGRNLIGFSRARAIYYGPTPFYEARSVRAFFDAKPCSLLDVDDDAGPAR
jgi:hypothetical protein